MNECFYRKEGEELVTRSHPSNWNSCVSEGLTDSWF